MLKEHGKVISLRDWILDGLSSLQTKNPHPNVDATSGCLLHHYGVTEFKASIAIPSLRAD